MLSNRLTTILIAVILGIAAVTIPVYTALHLSKTYAEQQGLERISGYADEMMRLTVETGKQMDHAFAELEKLGADQCSPAGVKKMLEIQMASSMLQAVGYIQGQQLRCTSFGTDSSADLGAPLKKATPRGTLSWLNVSLPFAPGQSFNIYANHGHAVILHRQQVVDLYSQEKDLSLAVAILDPGFIPRQRGGFQTRWYQHYVDTGETTFQMDGHWVVIVPNLKVNIAGMAAIPISAIDHSLGRLAYIFLPLGAGIGILLAIIVYCIARQRVSFEADMRSALRKNEFFMLYQPIVDLHTGKFIGAEALVRWRDTDNKIISPDVFIPVAEQRGLITEVTEKVIDLVAEDVPELWRAYPEVYISINLSSEDMQSHKTTMLLSDFLLKTRAPRGNLVVEATERGFVDAAQAKAIINSIRALGIKVAVDDFGTGYSSLSYLETLDLDYLKIDKSFVDTLCTEAATGSVALHIIEMAKSLKLEMIAEGVEQESQAEFLRRRGVQKAQGWLFGKPMTMDQLLMAIDKQQQDPLKQCS